MVEIRKNNKTMTVTRSAYNNYYRQNGWYTVEGKKNNNVVESENENIENNSVEENSVDEVTDDDWADIEDEESEEEGIEKPLSEMNRNELEAKASELGLNISNIKSNKQLREIIKKHQ